MLYPQESESRELKDLNGIWTFKASTSPHKSRKATPFSVACRCKAMTHSLTHWPSSQQDVENQGIINKWWLQPLTPPVIAMPVPASYNDITQGFIWPFTDLLSFVLAYFDFSLGPQIDNALRRHIGLVWYEREFWVSKGWQDQRIVLRFESVSYAATVWLNTVQVRKIYISVHLHI